MCELCYGCIHFQVCRPRGEIDDALDEVLIPLKTKLYDSVILYIDHIVKAYCHYYERAADDHKSRRGATLPEDTGGDTDEVDRDMDEGDQGGEQNSSGLKDRPNGSPAVCHGDKGSGWIEEAAPFDEEVWEKLIAPKFTGHETWPVKLEETGRWPEPREAVYGDPERWPPQAGLKKDYHPPGCHCAQCNPFGIRASFFFADHVSGCRCGMCQRREARAVEVVNEEGETVSSR